MRRLVSAIASLTTLSLILVAGCGDDTGGAPDSGVDPACQFWTEADDIETPANYTPRWAFEPWISKDISDGADTRAFVQGFEERDIPVGAVVIDSPWETHYNTYVVNEERYPDFEQLVDDLHAKDIRVVMWITQMFNDSSIDLESTGDEYEGESPNFREGLDCNFYVNEGDTYLWWKGTGAGIDFFNRDAVAWMRRQQDPLLGVGIDGWKLDFGDEYIFGTEFATAEGLVDKQRYSEAYYEEFWRYGVHKNGREFVTMVRPYDMSYGFPGRFFARPEHTPVGWVGDNRRDFVGLVDALDHLFRSAAAGYSVIGSDIGGYLDFDDRDVNERVPFDTYVFAKWTAVSGLMPFFQLHGRANIAPWTVEDNVDETVALYRYWATLHSELVPFFYSLSQEHLAGGDTILKPIGTLADWDGDYRFEVGDAALVAPILDATGIRDVDLPAGTRWYDWWDPAAVYDGGQTLTAYDASERVRLPVFVREGAILPAHVRNDATGLGTAASVGSLTVVAYPGATPSTFRLHDDDDDVTTITTMTGALTLSRALKPVIARVHRDAAPDTVTAGGANLAERADRPAFDAASDGWYYDAAARVLWVKVGASAAAVAITWASI